MKQPSKDSQNFLKRISKKSFTLVEVIVTLFILGIVFTVLMRIFFTGKRITYKVTTSTLARQMFRVLNSYLRKDIREAVIMDLITPPFILSDPYPPTPEGKYVLFKTLRFARFDKYAPGINKYPPFKKIIYRWDEETHTLFRGVWKGPWDPNADYKIVGERPILKIKDGSVKFALLTTDMQDQYGVTGKTYVLVYVNAALQDGTTYETVFLYSSRNINGAEEDPGWNDSPGTVPPYEDFQK